MNHLVWQETKVTYEDRCKNMDQKGLAVWFTGLSGSGKSTVAVELEKLLTQRGLKAYLLDGDNIRHGINADLGFSDADRIENIRRITEIAALFQDAGMITLVSFITPFAEMRLKAKEKIGAEKYFEVYVKAELETCMKRDPKGLYAKQLDNFTGVTSAYEIPQHPDIILETESISVRQCAELVMAGIEKRISVK